MSAPNTKPQAKKKRERLKEDTTIAKSPSKSKRPRLIADTITHGTSAFPNFLLNSDIASEVFSFLDIRSLYNVTMTSKVGMSLLRHEHVVRSAMMQGGHSKTSMERLVPLIEKRCIWIPSPIRMLRLVNGRTCERCCRGRVHLVSDHYGVFFCFHGCIQNNSTKGVAFNNRWSPFLVDQPRIAKSAYSSSAYIWMRPYTDKSGERCGPLISMVEMERTMRGDGTVEDLLREKDAIDKHKHAVSAISQVFKDSTEAAARRIEERKQRKNEASAQASDRRKTKILGIIQTLHAELEDVPWKDVALAYRWKKSNSKEVPSFDCGLTNELLREYSSAPSKASKKKLKEVTRSLRASFEIVENKGFHDFSFLSDTNPVERAVKEFCIANFPNYTILRTLNDRTLRQIQTCTTSSELMRELISLTLTLKNANLGAILAPAIVSSTVGAIQSDNLRKIAIQQCRLLAANELGGSNNLHYWTRIDTNPRMTPLELYHVLESKFPGLFQNTIDFYDAPETVAWKEEHARAGYGRHGPEAAMERLDAIVRQVWRGPMSTIEHLLTRDYKAVLKILWDREVLIERLE